MAAGRKLQADVEKLLKKVEEGLEEFSSTWENVHRAYHENQRDKAEVELKTLIKKLQRDREQIKMWQSDKAIKDKHILAEVRKRIEVEMERFKEFERDAKTKQYSKEGLMKHDRVDPDEEERRRHRAWIQESCSKLRVQVDEMEAEVELQSNKKSKGKVDEALQHLKHIQEAHRWHTTKLEQLLRKLDNDEVHLPDLDELKDLVEYYLEDNSREPEVFQTYNEIYEPFHLEEVEDYRAARDRAGTAHEEEVRDEDADGGNAVGSSEPKPGHEEAARPAPAVPAVAKHIGAAPAKASPAVGPAAPTVTRVPARAAPKEGGEGASQTAKAWQPMGVWTNLPPSAAKASAAPPAQPAKTAVPAPRVQPLQPSVPPPVQPAPAPERPPAPSAQFHATLNNPPNQPPPKLAPQQPPQQPPQMQPPTQAPPQPPLPAPPAGSPPGSAGGSTTSSLAGIVSNVPVPPPPMPPPLQAQDAATAAAASAISQPPQMPVLAVNEAPPAVPSGPPPPPPPCMPPPPPAPAPAASSAVAPGAPPLPGAAAVPAQVKKAGAEREPPQLQPPPAPLAGEDRGQLPKVPPPSEAPPPPMQSPPPPPDVSILTGSPMATQRPSLSESLGGSPIGDFPPAAPDLFRAPTAPEVPGAASSSGATGSSFDGSSWMPPHPSTPAGGRPDSSANSPEAASVLSPRRMHALDLLAASHRHLPAPADGRRTRKYMPRNPYVHKDTCGADAYPSQPTRSYEDPAMFEKYELDTLFFIFYYQQGTYQQHLAAKELKKLSWRYHKQYMTWFQRHEEPRHTAPDYERGAYVYFDNDVGWCQRIKADFTFEYQHLEDDPM